MGQLRIVASGGTVQAQANTRGKLLERLMALVLRQNGYQIDRTPSVNYSGMEIDIEGKHSVSGIPFYAECKCYDTDVDCPKLQAFFGKFMTRWLRDARSHGLFVALPGINSHARGFYRDNIESDTRITCPLFEEQRVVDAILDAGLIARPEQVAGTIRPETGTPGDRLLLYTDKGLFWVQYVILVGSAISAAYAAFSAKGDLLTDRATLDYLCEVLPELGNMKPVVPVAGRQAPQQSAEQDPEEIVEVRGSSSCFEYQFPASPEVIG